MFARPVRPSAGIGGTARASASVGCRIQDDIPRIAMSQASVRHGERRPPRPPPAPPHHHLGGHFLRLVPHQQQTFSTWPSGRGLLAEQIPSHRRRPTPPGPATGSPTGSAAPVRAGRLSGRGARRESAGRRQPPAAPDLFNLRGPTGPGKSRVAVGSSARPSALAGRSCSVPGDRLDALPLARRSDRRPPPARRCHDSWHRSWRIWSPANEKW